MHLYILRLHICIYIYWSYEKIVLAGDFNAQKGEWLCDTFLYQHELHSIKENSICYKNPNNPSKIDLILTNCSRSFFKMEIIFTGLPDFHKLVLPVFKTKFTKSAPKEIIYRNYRKFNKKKLIKIFIINFPQRNQKTILLLKRNFYKF